jgi:hypothetical protein
MFDFSSKTIYLNLWSEEEQPHEEGTYGTRHTGSHHLIYLGHCIFLPLPPTHLSKAEPPISAGALGGCLREGVCACVSGVRHHQVKRHLAADEWARFGDMTLQRGGCCNSLVVSNLEPPSPPHSEIDPACNADLALEADTNICSCTEGSLPS